MAFYIPPQFLDRLAVHITKNFLDLPNVKVPLILGLHGRKGEGKTFMCELVFKRMGLGAVFMSAGELESPDAGDPARLIRLRYREAGEWSRVHGRMAVLMINDVDAGIGRVDSSTQYTVNTQLVNATLMNIADNPTNVQLPGSYDAEPTQRIPIIVTGNDFATLYAPLIRDGRMEKFFWDPTRDDRLGIVTGIFEADGVPAAEVEKLVDTFPDQATDFFGAVRSRLYDEQIRKMIYDIGIDQVSQKVVHSDGKPQEFRKPNVALAHLIDIGNAMVREQERIRELRLVAEYNEVLQTPRSPSSSTHPSTHSPAAHSPAEYSPAAHSFSPVKPTSAPPSGEYFAYYGSGDAPNPVKPSNGQATKPPGAKSAKVSNAIAADVTKLLSQGLRLAVEYVDERRFRVGSWQCFGVYQASADEAIAALDTCLGDHPHDYVRLVGIDGDRRRVADVMVQRGSKG